MNFPILIILKKFKREIEYSIRKKPYHFPLFFLIQTINQCNGSCIMCPIKKNKNKKSELMSDELFDKIIQEIVKESKSAFISLYLQNEPLLDEKLFQRIQLIKKLSDRRIKTSFVTNGCLFSDNKIKELEKSGNDLLCFSIDAYTEETYNKIRRGLNFIKLHENINKVLKTNYRKHIYVEFVVQKDNKEEYKKFKQYWKKKKVPVMTNYLTNRSSDLENYDELCLDKIEVSIINKIIISVLYKRIIKCCPLPLSIFHILSNGDVILCCNDYSKKIVLGNVLSSTIKEIWNSEKYNEIRKLLYQRQSEQIPLCRNCYTNYPLINGGIMI